MTEAGSSELPSGLSDVQEPGQARRTDLFAAIWRALIEPWLLVILAAVLAVALSTAYSLPQLPGQARNESGASQRWLVDAADAAGSFGPLWRSLGLFDVLHSPLFQASMALMGVVLLVQLAHLILNAIAMYRLPNVLDEAGTNGEPLMVQSAGNPPALAPFACGSALECQRTSAPIAGTALPPCRSTNDAGVASADGWRNKHTVN